MEVLPTIAAYQNAIIMHLSKCHFCSETYDRQPACIHVTADHIHLNGLLGQHLPVISPFLTSHLGKTWGVMVCAIGYCIPAPAAYKTLACAHHKTWPGRCWCSKVLRANTHLLMQEAEACQDVHGHWSCMTDHCMNANMHASSRPECMMLIGVWCCQERCVHCKWRQQLLHQAQPIQTCRVPRGLPQGRQLLSCWPSLQPHEAPSCSSSRQLSEHTPDTWDCSMPGGITDQGGLNSGWPPAKRFLVCAF